MVLTTLTLATQPPNVRPPQYQQLKGRVHTDLLNRLRLDKLANITREDAEPELRSLIVGILEREQETTPLSFSEREALIVEVLDELFGLGPLETLLADRSISDILVNRFDQVYIEREGRLEETDVVFRDDRHLLQIIERIVSAVGRRIDESSPMVDARLADGSRVNAIIPPLALNGPALSIRRFRTDRLGADDLVDRDSLTGPMLEFLKVAVGCRLNLIVSGGTGAGQTTLTASAGGASASVSVTVEAAPVDARTAIPDLIAAYARALESKDINAVRRAYPGMTSQQERDFSTALPNLQSANLNIESIDDQGDTATAMVRGEYVFLFDGRRQQTPVSFRASFERAGTGWRMTRTQ